MAVASPLAGELERSCADSRATGAGVELWPIRQGVRLVAVNCILGAYQGRWILYPYDPGRWPKLPLP